MMTVLSCNVLDATIFLEDKSKEKAREDELQLPTFDFATIAAATDHFSDGNKLGEGGFGPVYKVRFPESLSHAFFPCRKKTATID